MLGVRRYEVVLRSSDALFLFNSQHPSMFSLFYCMDSLRFGFSLFSFVFSAIDLFSVFLNKKLSFSFFDEWK